MGSKLASLSFAFVSLFHPATSGSISRLYFEQGKTATISGKVTSSTVANREYEIIVSLKGCKCADCHDEQKCDCCIPQSIQTHDHGHFDLAVRAGTYFVEVKGNTKSRVEVTVQEGESGSVEIRAD